MAIICFACDGNDLKLEKAEGPTGRAFMVFVRWIVHGMSNYDARRLRLYYTRRVLRHKNNSATVHGIICANKNKKYRIIYARH